jgi:hypothetical protein
MRRKIRRQSSAVNSDTVRAPMSELSRHRYTTRESTPTSGPVRQPRAEPPPHKGPPNHGADPTGEHTGAHADEPPTADPESLDDPPMPNFLRNAGMKQVADQKSGARMESQAGRHLTAWRHSCKRLRSVLTARSSRPHELDTPHWMTIAFRWSLGLAVVSWRYLWQITPLHRREEAGDVRDLPPPLPEYRVDEHNQLMNHGAGPLFHRRFTVRIDEPTMTAQELIATLATDLNQTVPSEVTSVDKQSGDSDDLTVGDEMTVRIPGPWDGPVRVVNRTETSFRFATLNNHMEAGQIEFRARSQDASLHFEIEAWARPCSPVVNLMYTHLRLAKEIQLNMWGRFCLATAHLAGGRVRHGITIHTRVVQEQQWQHGSTQKSPANATR